MENQVIVTTQPVLATSITGELTGQSVSDMFTPLLNRDMYLTLSGTWSGVIQVQRSTDNGKTWNNVTVGGGNPWLNYTQNCDETFDTPTDPFGVYRLDATLTSGTATYRLAQ